MESKAKLLGHPAHPILVAFPLGLLATSVAFDVAGGLLDKEELVSTGFWMATAGTVTGVVAAVPSLIDYLGYTERDAGEEDWVAAWSRERRGVVIVCEKCVPAHGETARQFHRIDHAFSRRMLLAVATGWLGGELVDRLGVGVDDNANLNAPNSLTNRRVSKAASNQA